MVKVVVKNLRAKYGEKAKQAVKRRRVAGPNGRPVDILTLETGSDSFGNDLLYAFRDNVATARRANTDILGVPDFLPELADLDKVLPAFKQAPKKGGDPLGAAGRARRKQ